MNHKRRVAVQFTEEMLLDRLGLDPEHFSLMRIHHEDYGVVRIIIDGESLPQISEGQEPPIRAPEQIINGLVQYKEDING